jgi:hypothetical protein
LGGALISIFIAFITEIATVLLFHLFTFASSLGSDSRPNSITSSAACDHSSLVYIIV